MPKQGRRGHGEGGVTQRRDGRWMGRVSLGWRDGKRLRKTVYGHTRREVTDKLRTLLQEAHDGMLTTDERQTVGEFLRQWLQYKQMRLRSNVRHVRAGRRSAPPPQSAASTPREVDAGVRRAVVLSTPS